MIVLSLACGSYIITDCILCSKDLIYQYSFTMYNRRLRLETLKSSSLKTTVTRQQQFSILVPPWNEESQKVSFTHCAWRRAFFQGEQYICDFTFFRNPSPMLKYNSHYVVVNIYIFVTNIHVIPTIPTQNFKSAIDRNLLM